MNDEIVVKQIEFGKLTTGAKFFLSRPTDDRAAFTKIQSQKDERGTWSNAKNIYGLTTFVQYDKRIWIKS